MADHVRKQIRAAAVTALTGLATTGGRVYASRVYPMEDANLPGLRIDTNEEEVFTDPIHPNPVLDRVLTLVVQACVKQTSTYNDTLDQVVKEVEVALAGAQTLGGAKYVQLRSISVALAGEGEKPVAVGTLLYEVRYFTAQNAPDIAA